MYTYSALALLPIIWKKKVIVTIDYDYTITVTPCLISKYRDKGTKQAPSVVFLKVGGGCADSSENIDKLIKTPRPKKINLTCMCLSGKF